MLHSKTINQFQHIPGSAFSHDRRLERIPVWSQDKLVHANSKREEKSLNQTLTVLNAADVSLSAKEAQKRTAYLNIQHITYF